MAQALFTNGAAPATPAAGVTAVYSKTDKTLAYKDDAGNEYVLPSMVGIQSQTYTAFTTGGTSTAYTLTPTPAISAPGGQFDITFHTAAGATPTLSISGTTAKNLKYRDSTGAKQPITATQVPTNWRSPTWYDGTDYVVLEVADRVQLGNFAAPPAIGGTTPAAGAFTTLSITAGAIISGTYTPTLFNTTNVAASTAYSCQYLRVGNVVTVSGWVSIDPTSATVATVLGMSLPVASNITAYTEIGGTFATDSIGGGDGGAIYGDSTNDRAIFGYIPSSAANIGFGFSFTYKVN